MYRPVLDLQLRRGAGQIRFGDLAGALAVVRVLQQVTDLVRIGDGGRFVIAKILPADEDGRERRSVLWRHRKSGARLRHREVEDRGPRIPDPELEPLLRSLEVALELLA